MLEYYVHALLFDFYGELLNKHQREIYSKYITEDLSLGEIAEEKEVSRQAVHEVIKRSTKTMEKYEEKLRAVEMFLKTRTTLLEIEELMDQEPELEIGELKSQIRAKCEELLKEL